MDALVTDVHLRSALSGLRGLGRAGVRVTAVAPGRLGAGRWSRYAAERLRSPDPGENPVGFAAAIGELARRDGPVLVYPGREEALDALISPAARLPEEAILPYSDPTSWAHLRDKRALVAPATEAGLSPPRTLVEASAGELARDGGPTPCALKPALPGGAMPTTRLVETEAELRGLAGDLPADEPLVVQERADGPLTVLAVVIGRDGELVARFQQLVHRTWPLGAGSSARAVSVEPDDDLVERSRRLLAGAGFVGLAALDVVATSRGPALLDVNPRFYDSQPLALACGVNLPAAWHGGFTGRQPPPLGDYRTGVSFRWLEADVVGAFRHSPRLLLEPVPRPRAGSVWARDDPAPGVLLGAAMVTGRVGKRIHRRRRRPT